MVLATKQFFPRSGRVRPDLAAIPGAAVDALTILVSGQNGSTSRPRRSSTIKRAQLSLTRWFAFPTRL